MKKNSPWVYLLLILPPLFWAGNSVLARGVAELIPPVAMSFWRWLIALVILLPFTARQTLKDWPQIRAGWKNILLLGFFGIASFNTLLYTAAHSTTAINIALTQSVMPAIIVLISYLMFHDRISRRQIFAILLCVIGAGYIIIHGDIHRLLSLKFVIGDLLMLLAVCLYALYSVLLRNRPAIHPLSFLTTTFAVGVVLLLPLYLWEQGKVPALTLSQPVILSLLYVALCPSILAYLCWNRGIHEIGANRAGLYINLIPLFAALLAVIFLGERFSAYHLVGIFLIFFGLLLFNLPLKRTRG
ncbi:MAG: EamA family transporter [Desulfuromonadales bacterium]|nr:EamA family transporter [Desulfuromonadales bacterium]MBN2793299.1 EamA family transporter [Desulfuromonadales bacterium]